MPRRVPDRNKGAATALRNAGVSIGRTAAIAGVSPETAKRAGGRQLAGHGATKAPLAGAASSDRALEDLNEQREALLAMMRSGGISPRDLAGVSAELRKVNQAITQMEMLSLAGGDEDEPEEVRDAAARVRAKLEKMADKKIQAVEAAPDAVTTEPLAQVAG